ncbi:ABC transporter permease [Pelagibacterium xiamenense]|uniref:ABC transporter permease n=1 Tax=Pelagibacterium xiamenense TaxID=2901140 RepID=UPI001E4B1706|nr:ABC transporter permease [Pelagibacterium xiamenense]MCD7058928.1 ABC transporter permease [Pelagibacterium xiamenense]
MSTIENGAKPVAGVEHGPPPRHHPLRLINRAPSRRLAVFLGALPFVALVVAYTAASHVRRLDNPSDRLLPSLESIGAAFFRLATERDVRTGDITLWVDTFDSLTRLGLGLGVALAFALVLGIAIGFLPHIRSALAPFIAAVSLIPPITILPILFIALGLGETSKIALITLGTAPVMIRSMAQAVIDIPREQMVKVQTLGASTWQIVTRVVLPQMMPKLIAALRLALVPGWIFLISAEAIASTSGLGYRIFLVRRYLAMDVILSYVIWITILAYLLDRLLLWWSRSAFWWSHLEGDSL